MVIFYLIFLSYQHRRWNFSIQFTYLFAKANNADWLNDSLNALILYKIQKIIKINIHKNQWTQNKA